MVQVSKKIVGSSGFVDITNFLIRNATELSYIKHCRIFSLAGIKDAVVSGLTLVCHFVCKWETIFFFLYFQGEMSWLQCKIGILSQSAC